MEVIEQIKQWVLDRNLQAADPKVQMCKTIEELGELARAINKGDVDGQVDGIGDVVVTLVCISQQLGLDFEHCVQSAYNEIKDRKGKMIGGVFVKDADLPVEPKGEEFVCWRCGEVRPESERSNFLDGDCCVYCESF